MDPLRVIVVDDSLLFRAGLAALLAPAGVTVASFAASPKEAMVRVAADQPDVVIMDIRMPPSFSDEGLRAAHELKTERPGLGILLLSGHVEVVTAARVFDEHSHGIGYLLKDRVASVETLVDALGRVHRGELVLDGEVVERLFRRRKNVRLLEKLSDRERTVLQHMAEGRSNAGIAERMHVAPKTVETYAASVFGKLGLTPSGDDKDNRRVLAVLTWLRTRTE
jgi:DNA-binding NarL/FixJ family response regulator